MQLSSSSLLCHCSSFCMLFVSGSDEAAATANVHDTHTHLSRLKPLLQSPLPFSLFLPFSLSLSFPCSLPVSLWGLFPIARGMWSAVGSFSGVQDEAAAAVNFGAFWAWKKDYGPPSQRTAITKVRHRKHRRIQAWADRAPPPLPPIGQKHRAGQWKTEQGRAN